MASRELERYRALPLPTTTDEHWRFTNLRGFDPDSFEPAEATVEVEAPIDGVVKPLDGHERLGTLLRPDDKFEAHNAAMWRDGLLVHVPAGVTVEQPVVVRVRNVVANGAVFWRLLVVVEAGASLVLIEEYESERPDLPGYSNAVAELFVEQGAKLEYVSVQRLSSETWHFATHRARLERDSTLDLVAGGFGSKRGKVRIESELAGPGASSRVTGAYLIDGEQHLDYDTFQEHSAPHTTSDFIFKGALYDRARAVWRGMIRVEREAQRTNAYQENRNLILSPKAHADSIPGLEILANDVRCTHGATASPVNEELLFYCMARGLSRGEAERLIVRGFFTDVLDRLELPAAREALARGIEARLPSG